MNEAVQQLVFFALLILGLYLLVLRPQRARARAIAQIRADMKVGSRVITTAGIHATVVAIEDDEVLLEVAPGVQVRFAKVAVVALLDPAQDQLSSPAEPDGAE